MLISTLHALLPDSCRTGLALLRRAAQGGEYTPSGINRTSSLALCGEGERGGGRLCLNRAMRDDQINLIPLSEQPEEDS